MCYKDKQDESGQGEMKLAGYEQQNCHASGVYSGMYKNVKNPLLFLFDKGFALQIKISQRMPQKEQGYPNP
jgi:hypothetical protein